ncbi:hypothetical protein IW492_12285 [Enterococcus sp. BWB1-3]|nr:hypothetical protein [Enterococcus sp. BWB1-3]MBL1230012.1 hypothetical protein [Enterococcus sp. BWB1-3]
MEKVRRESGIVILALSMMKLAARARGKDKEKRQSKAFNKFSIAIFLF